MKIEEVIQKIEEITPRQEPQEEVNQSYWYPLSKGTNRLLLVLGILIAIIAAANEDFRKFFFDDEDKGYAYFFPFLIVAIIEYILYLTGIWIYQGYKESNKDKE